LCPSPCHLYLCNNTNKILLYLLPQTVICNIEQS
jgi:hypothetical protein